MFSWRNPGDVSVIKGEAEFEMRLLEAPLDNPYECLPWGWRVLFEDTRKKQREDAAGCAMQ